MSEKNDAKDTRIRDKIMEITKGTKIREKVIKDGKVAVYLETGSDGEFIVEEDKTGIINKIPYKKHPEQESKDVFYTLSDKKRLKKKVKKVSSMDFSHQKSLGNMSREEIDVALFGE